MRIFANRESCLRLVRALAVGMHGSWAVSEHRVVASKDGEPLHLEPLDTIW